MDLKFSQLQMACCPSLSGHSELFIFVESSALVTKVLGFGFSLFWNLEFVWANKSSSMKPIELGWRFCANIWHISTWFSLMRFSIKQSRTLVEECFLHTLCPLVGCHDALSSTEIVRLDVLLSKVLDVLHSNRDLNASVGLSLKLFHPPQWRVTIWQYSRFLRFFCCLLSVLKHSGSLRFEQIETIFVLLDRFRLLRWVPFTFSWTSCSRQGCFCFCWNNCIVSNRLVGLVQFLWLQYWQLAQLQLRSLDTTALATFLHLYGAMPASLRIPWGLRWTSILSQYLLGFRLLWHVSIDPWESFPVFLQPCWQQTLAVSCELTVTTIRL